MGKGSNTTSSSTSNTSSADPQAAAAYRDILQRAQGVASTPYQAYTGDLTAPINAQQQTGIANINANAGYAAPNLAQASGLAAGAANPLTQQQIQSYLNPYTQNVVDTTNAQMAHDNATQMASLQGNQIAQGALGGNSTGVAKAILAGQQGRTMAGVDAGLYSQGYQGALQTAAQQYQQNPLAAGNALANYGISGQNAALTGATAQVGAGSMEQQTEQARLNALYQQYAQAQAYPYQQTQWLGGIATGVGSNLGGTTQGAGTTTGPAPNQTAQWIGAGLSAAALLSDREAKEDIERIGRMNDGTPIYRFRYKGSPQWHVGPMAQDVEKRNPDAVSRGVDGYRYVDMHEASEDSVERAAGGAVTSPWGDAKGWIPTIGISAGHGAPGAMSAPSAPTQPAFDPSKMASGIAGAGKGLGGLDWGGLMGGGLGAGSEAWGGGSFLGKDAFGGSSASPLPGLDASDYGAGFARGGGVAGYAGGGAPGIDFTDPAWDTGEPENFAGRFAPAEAGPIGRPFGVMPKPAEPIYDDGQGPVRLTGQRPEGSSEGLRGTPMAPVVAEDDDEAPTPVGVAGRTGGAGTAPVMAFGPEGGKNAYGALPDAVRRPAAEDRGGLGLLPISPNASHGMLSAGLGMLASRSPFLGNAIGEGGLTGVAAYGKAEENDRKIAAEADKLSREQRQQAVENLMGERKQTETERHNVAAEKNSASQRSKFIPAGSIVDGESVRPLVLDQASGRIIDATTGQPPATGAKIIPQAGKGTTPINDDDARAIAQYYVSTGDNSRLNGLGITSAARQAVQKHIREEMDRQKVTPEEMGTRVAEFAGRKAGQRTLATQEAKMGSAAYEAEGAIKQARGIIEKLPRTSFLPLNQLIQGFQKKTLNPDQAELYARAQAIVNTYAAVMARGANITTDSSRHKAESLLSTANDPAVFNRVLDTLLQEINMAKHSPEQMREHYRRVYGPKSLEPEAGGAAAAAAAPAAGATFIPPAGAIARQYQGKTFYYDPNTKQPYPGQ